MPSKAAKRGRTGKRGKTGPVGRRGPRGKRGPKGLQGRRGRVGPTGARGRQGVVGPKDEWQHQLAQSFEERFADVYRQLDTQLKRMGQMQAEIDRLVRRIG